MISDFKNLVYCVFFLAGVPLASAGTLSLRTVPPGEWDKVLAGLQANKGKNGSGLMPLRRQHAGKNGQLTFTRYRQTIGGVPVFGHHVITKESADGRLLGLYGTAVLPDNEESLWKGNEPGWGEAREAARRLFFQNARKPLDRIFSGELSERVVRVGKDGQLRTGYHVTFFSDTKEGGDPTRPVWLLDQQLKPVRHWDGLAYSEGHGPGGNEKVGRYVYGEDYPPFGVGFTGGHSTMRTDHVVTINLDHGSSGSDPWRFAGSHNDHKEINGSFSPLNDAHFFGGVVFRMYSEWLDTAPLDTILQMRVHYSRNYENAFWNGQAMTFGDGGSTFYPLVSLDVSAHEVSHGFTEQNSNLIYSGQPGGINEAFSDMAGEAAEYFMRGSNDFLVGFDIMKGDDVALRYMDQPERDGRSVGHVDSYHEGMDVHYSSGIFNRAFYLLAGTPEWDTRRAFILFARANQNYWEPSSGFLAAAQGVCDAARDLEYSTDDVQAAFAAVGVPVNKCATGLQLELTLEANDDVEKGEEKSYGPFTIGDGEVFRVVMEGEGDGDLYVRFGSPATRDEWDCRPYRGTSNETCDLFAPAGAGTAWIMVHGYNTASYSLRVHQEVEEGEAQPEDEEE